MADTGDAILAVMNGFASGLSKGQLHREEQQRVKHQQDAEDKKLAIYEEDAALNRTAKELSIKSEGRRFLEEERQSRLRERLNDPNSDETATAKARYEFFGLKTSPKDTAATLEKAYGQPEEYAKIAYKGKQDRLTEAEKSKAKKSFSDMPTDVKTRVGFLADAFQNLTDYEKHFEEGQRPKNIDANTPYVGKLKSDTPITASSRLIAENLGRVNSGGVINKEETAAFLAMLPRPNDDETISREKLGQFRRMMETKLQGYGINSNTLAGAGFDVGKLGYDQQGIERRIRLATPQKKQSAKEPAKKSGGSSLIPSAEAAEPSKRKVTASELDEYAKTHGMSLDDAKSWLGSQGYATD